MKVNNKTVLILLLLSLTLVSVVSAAIPTTQSFNLVIRNSTGQIVNGSTNVSIRIYSDFTGGTALLVQNKTRNIDETGVFPLTLTGLNIDYSSPKYLSVEVNGDGEGSPRLNISTIASAFQSRNLSTNLGAAQVTKKTGTNFLNKLLSTILEDIYANILAINSTSTTPHTNRSDADIISVASVYNDTTFFKGSANISIVNGIITINRTFTGSTDTFNSTADIWRAVENNTWADIFNVLNRSTTFTGDISGNHSNYTVDNSTHADSCSSLIGSVTESQVSDLTHTTDTFNSTVDMRTATNQSIDSQSWTLNGTNIQKTTPSNTIVHNDDVKEFYGNDKDVYIIYNTTGGYGELG
jgi:hypothetical protein